MSLTERSADFLMSTMLHIETELCNCGIDKKDAHKISQNTVEHLRKDYGGEHFYFPKGKDLDAILKHSAIYKEFTGNNHSELAKKFDVSITHIYRVIKIAHKEEIDKRQPQLF